MSSIVSQKIGVTGTAKVHYMPKAPYFTAGLAWYKTTVDPKGDELAFLGYVISVAVDMHCLTFQLFDGLGYVRCAGPNEMTLASVAQKFAHMSKGFVVELPVLSLFVDETMTTKQPTNQPTLL